MKVSNPVVTQPQDTETQSCESTSATAAPKEASTADTVKTAAKVAGIAVDQFEKFASATKGLEKFAGPAHVTKYGLKALGAGITAATHYDKAASTTTAGKLAESAAAGGMALTVAMSGAGLADFATGSHLSKGLIGSTSSAIALADGFATGRTDGVERQLERLRSGDFGFFGKQLGNLSDSIDGDVGVYVAEQLEEGPLRDALDGKAGIYLADKLESFKESLKDEKKDDKKK